MAIARSNATSPPETAIDSAVLCAVSMGAVPAALTNVPAPVPRTGACTNACQPAVQMFNRWFRSPP